MPLSVGLTWAFQKSWCGRAIRRSDAGHGGIGRGGFFVAGGTSFEDAAGGTVSCSAEFTIPRHVTQLTGGRLNIGSRIDKGRG